MKFWDSSALVPLIDEVLADAARREGFRVVVPSD